MAEINRLLAGYPPGNWIDPEEALRGYLLAVEDYPADDVTAAVDSLIKGVAPGVNPGFLPPPAVVGSECHRQNHLRAEREARDRALRPRLPPPDIERTAESQARVRALMERTVNGLRAQSTDEDPVERHRRVVARANQYWDVGDPEGAEDAA